MLSLDKRAAQSYGLALLNPEQSIAEKRCDEGLVSLAGNAGSSRAPAQHKRSLGSATGQQ
ncbi:hypothetical protein [Variovorax sp. GB1P17]|uniref:hypothetical protein n=1 Tax=Variovorax sp. GB1P17 TaxID=3443740 RepID=UPI003F445721